MIRILSTLLLILFVASCSFNEKSTFWTKGEKISREKQKIIKVLFKDEKVQETEFNPNLKINIKGKTVNNSFINNLNNNSGRTNYNGKLKNISRFKFSKIDNFNQYEPSIIFSNNNVIFFDNIGSILKFDNSSKLIWKKNHYSKSEKKLKPILFFANNRDTLIVVDTIAKLYAMNIKTGELLWSKNNSAHFNSQVKVYKDKFFTIDTENVLTDIDIQKIKIVPENTYLINNHF